MEHPHPVQFFLYGTTSCHLCEKAEMLLKQIKLDQLFIMIDIAEDDQLLAVYGTLIPVVLHCSSRAELRWPFDHTELTEFIRTTISG